MKSIITSMDIQLKSSSGTSSARYYGNGGFENGRVVLCLHGFPDNNTSFDFQVDSLVEQGFTCVMPTLRGYEPSSLSNDGNYSILDIAEDIEAWRKQFDLETFHLVGHDWGALISYIYAAKYGQHLNSLTTLAVPPLNILEKAALMTPIQWKKSWYIGFFQLRGISERKYAKNHFTFMNKLWKNWSPGWHAETERIEKVKTTFQQAGVTNAALSYYRCLIKDVISRRAKSILKTPIEVPTLIMAGKKDGCMDISLYKKAIRNRYFPKGVTFHSFEHAGHFLHQEIPETLNPVLIEWLNKHS